MKRKSGPKAPSKRASRAARKLAGRPEPPQAFYSPEVAHIYRKRKR